LAGNIGGTATPAPGIFPGEEFVTGDEMRRLRRVLLSACLAALAAGPASAQWVRLQRCAGAIPCSIPFGVVYGPDPLIAAQYGRISPTGVSGRVSLDGKPTVELDVHAVSPDFAREAARRFVIAHPPPPKTGD
jgi:hypothetical protein